MEPHINRYPQITNPDTLEDLEYIVNIENLNTEKENILYASYSFIFYLRQ